MYGVVAAIPNVEVDAFDYQPENMQWVTNDNIGPKLAWQIHCIAANSRKAGGYGKVVLVAHSMGGLAARFVANQTIDDRSVADDMGLVVTIGTPHLGSQLASWVIDAMRPLCDFAVIPIGGSKRPQATAGDCADELDALDAISGLSVNSQKLQELKPFPSKLPVLALAGNVQQAVFSLFGVGLVSQDSDLVVGVTSALHESAHSEEGGGAATIDCVGTSTFPLFTDASCAHSNMVQDPHIQARVVDGIRQYIRWLTRPPQDPCPTTQQIADAITDRETSRGGTAPTVVLVAGPVCEGGYAGVVVLEDGSRTRAVLQQVSDDAWESLGACADFAMGGYCVSLPSRIDEFFHQQGVSS